MFGGESAPAVVVVVVVIGEVVAAAADAVVARPLPRLATESAADLVVRRFAGAATCLYCTAVVGRGLE